MESGRQDQAGPTAPPICPLPTLAQHPTSGGAPDPERSDRRRHRDFSTSASARAGRGGGGSAPLGQGPPLGPFSGSRMGWLREGDEGEVASWGPG